MTREQPPVARTLFAHKAESDKEFSVWCAAQEQRPAARSNQKTLQRCKLIIQLMLWAARAASDCGGVSDRRRASRAESDRKVAWPCEQLGQKPKPRSVPQKICHPPSGPCLLPCPALLKRARSASHSRSNFYTCAVSHYSCERLLRVDGWVRVH
jgi:hypothetical protein